MHFDRTPLQVSKQYQEALNQLWGSGPLGQYFAFMVSLTGVLNDLPLPQQLIDPNELSDIDSPLPYELGSQQIIDKYARLSSLESAFTYFQPCRRIIC